MNKSFVIRYADTGPDTIKSHNEVIQSNTKVFWGWWKKADEYDNYTELKSFKANCPLTIGIIDRDKQKYFKAFCTGIYLPDSNEKKIPTPEKKYTPDYYSEQPFPAWFELTSISPLTDLEFKSLFFDIPYGDPTLFTVSDTKINQSEVDKVDLSKFLVAKGNSILHLSDIHFGKDHNYKDSIKRTGSQLIDVIKPILANDREDIGIIVASGDFISRANTGTSHNSYSDAQVFLRDLYDYLGLTEKHLIIIPGNHDMPLIENETDPLQQGNYTSLFREFRYALKEVPKYKEIEYWAGFKTPNKWNLIFSYFNSAELKYPYLSNFGYIEKEKSDKIFRNLNESLSINKQDDFINQKIINFCVIHHHLKMFMPTQEMESPDPNQKEKPCQSVSVLLNAGMFEEDSVRAGMHFLLHGHQHLPYIGSTGLIENGERKNLNILSVGSAGSKLEKGYVNQAPYNSFSIYTPNESHLKVTIEKYNNVVGAIHPKAEVYEVPYL